MILPQAFLDLLYFGLAVLGPAVSAASGLLLLLALVDGLISISQIMRGGDI